MAQRNPFDPSTFNHKYATLSTGRRYHYVDEFKGSEQDFDPAKNPTLLCLHGFPESWYAWRHLIGPFVEQGYRVIAPDLLGFGETDKPDDLKEYVYSAISKDLIAILDLVGAPKAVVVGHDWGSLLAYRFVHFQPDRIAASVNLSVPYYPPLRQYVPLEAIVKTIPYFGYQLYLADYDSVKEIEENLHTFFAAAYQTPSSSYFRKVAFPGEMKELVVGHKDLEWDQTFNKELTTAEVDVILDTYRKSGLKGPTNWYRLTEVRFHDEKDLPDGGLPNVPWVIMYGTKDPTCSGERVEISKKWIPQVEIVKFEGKTHWLMVDPKDEVAKIVIDLVETKVLGKETGKASL